MTINFQNHTAPVNMGHEVLAVVDSAEGTQEVLRDLTAAGIPAETVMTLSGEEGVRRLDAHGHFSGPLTRIIRAFQRLNFEGGLLHRYETEVEHGHCVVDVPLHKAALRDTVVAILRARGGHFINVYTPWSTEEVTA